MAIALLVRHAVTEATGVRLGGWTPAHLSEEGREQAERTAERLAELPIEAIYASPLERTQDTARIVAKPHGLEVQSRDGLGEVDYGAWTDRPLDELRKEDLWKVIQRTPSRVAFPEGGTIRGAQARAVDVIEDLAAVHEDGAFVAVSHADVIKAVVAHFAGMPLDTFQRLIISPASVTVLLLPPGGMPMLLRVNDTGPITLPEPPDDEEKQA